MTLKKGDIVKVWSLQSFHGGGFLKGSIALVRQDQTGDSVLLIVNRKPFLDISYEVYDKQTELIKKATDSTIKMIDDFLNLNQKFRMKDLREKNNSSGYNFAPEFFINEKMEIELNHEQIHYPELLI